METITKEDLKKVESFVKGEVKLMKDTMEIMRILDMTSKVLDILIDNPNINILMITETQDYAEYLRHYDWLYSLRNLNKYDYDKIKCYLSMIAAKRKLL